MTSLVSLPFFCAVPVGTPVDPKGVRALPSAGPYYLASFTPGQGVELRRNPNYHGGRPHAFERIELSVGIPKAEVTRRVEAGAADYAIDGVATGLSSQLEARFGQGSAAAKAGRRQFFANRTLGVIYLALNPERPLFKDVRLRKAVNYAIDRRALARLGTPLSRNPDRPTDQYLPPGMPGFTDVRVYPFTPSLARAKRLAGATHRTAVLYACSGAPCDQIAQIVKADLARIGIDVQVKAYPLGEVFQRLHTKGEPWDLGWFGWLADYPDPAQFVNNLFQAGIVGTSGIPGYTNKLDAAARLSGPARYLAYGKLDADLARNAAPLVPYSNLWNYDFFSARIGCQVFQPAYTVMDLAALCIRP